MEKEKFEKLVKEAWNSLPSLFRKNVENLVILVEEDYDEEARELKKKKGGEILGYYRGVPLKHRGHYYGGVCPDTVVIFKRPIESIARSEEEIKKKIREVLFHEIGHYFGFKEEDLRKMGCG
ncbi:metallopeptidase family protein [Candidatus Calescamantes bacterium]|nr:metallopeptidase family protein [Candidatus Calescamantes bacterium]